MNTDIPDSGNGHPGSGDSSRTFHEGERTILWKRIVNRFRRLDVNKTTRRLVGRGREWWQLQQTQHPTNKKQPVFVVGSNRSGTNMVCTAIGRSPHGLAFQESLFSLAFEGYYLRSEWIIDRLIRGAPAPIVSFGSILDSQSTDRLLSRFEGAKAIWIYRRYEDVANSCARMQWGHQLKDYARWVARGELEKLGARGKRISNETIGLFNRLFHEEMSDTECASLYWYMRNQLYFDLNLHKDPRVLLVQYEDTVRHRERAFRRVFGFLGLPYHPVIIDGIYSSSVGKHPWQGVDRAVQDACEALQVRLDTHYARTSQWTPDSELAGEPVAGTPMPGGT